MRLGARAAIVALEKEAHHGRPQRESGRVDQEAGGNSDRV